MTAISAEQALAFATQIGSMLIHPDYPEGDEFKRGASQCAAHFVIYLETLIELEPELLREIEDTAA